MAIQCELTRDVIENDWAGPYDRLKPGASWLHFKATGDSFDDAVKAAMDYWRARTPKRIASKFEFGETLLICQRNNGYDFKVGIRLKSKVTSPRS